MSDIIVSECEKAILLALRELEFTGSLYATELGVPTHPMIIWGRSGVPGFLLRTWTHPLSKGDGYTATLSGATSSKWIFAKSGPTPFRCG